MIYYILDILDMHYKTHFNFFKIRQFSCLDKHEGWVNVHCQLHTDLGKIGAVRYIDSLWTGGVEFQVPSQLH